MCKFVQTRVFVFNCNTKLSFPLAVEDEQGRQGGATDDDSNSSVNQDAKLSKASSLYQGPSSGECCAADRRIQDTIKPLTQHINVDLDKLLSS